jgi:predicted acylesterase/phospholipase RssA
MLVILLLTLSLTLQSDKCRVLVLEGGGDRGAYHAGAFRALADNLPP